MALDATARGRRLWDRMAPRYDRDMRRLEPLLFGRDARPWVCAQASGDVLDVAIGTGLNLPHYPPGTRLTGVDLSPVMLAAAATRAADLGLSVDLSEAAAEHLPIADASFDTVVCTLSLCSVTDDRAAIAEMHRVLRPAGSSCCWTTSPPPTGFCLCYNGCGRRSPCASPGTTRPVTRCRWSHRPASS